MKLTSICNQQSYFSQTSAIASIGSKAPMTVVPAVALTKNGICINSTSLNEDIVQKKKKLENLPMR